MMTVYSTNPIPEDSLWHFSVPPNCSLLSLLIAFFFVVLYISLHEYSHYMPVCVTARTLYVPCICMHLSKHQCCTVSLCMLLCHHVLLCTKSPLNRCISLSSQAAASIFRLPSLSLRAHVRRLATFNSYALSPSYP